MPVASLAPVLDAGEERVGSPPLASLDVLASRKPASLCRWAAVRPVEPVFPSSDSSGSSVTRGLAPRRPSRRALLQHSQREGGGPRMPSPPSWGGAGLSEVTPSLRLSWCRVHLAVRRWSQRPSSDRWALDCTPSSFRPITRVSLRNGCSVFAPFSAVSAGSCPLALSGSGEPLTQGYPLHPSHLRWGCCMHYCGAPEAIGGRLQAFVRRRA